ncbi:MAG: MATE family efflux transporter [Parahaliea sp.]
MSTESAVFLSGNLMRHVVRMSLTTSIGLMAMFAVDLVDLIFISMLGNDALAAAVGYAGSLLFFTNAINIGFSIAAGSLVARAIGAGRGEEAREYATSVGLYAALTGIVLPLLILSQVESILSLFGAEGEVLALAARYVCFVVPSMWMVGVAMTAMAVLRAHGDARRSMMATLYGGTVNAVLDPILIFGLDFGLDGAALASVAARLAMLLCAALPLIRVYRGFAKPGLALMLRDATAIGGMAAPAVMTNIATPVGNAIVTREIAQFGTEAVAGMAIISRLMPVAFSVIFALSGAIGPIIGQNFGAGQYARVRRGFVAGVQFAGFYIVLVSALLFLLRSPIADLFDATGITRELVYLFCGVLALAGFFNGVIFVANASFNNLGHPLYSTWINWGRHTLGTWPLAIVGAHMAEAQGVLFGQAVGGIFFALIAWLLALRVMRTSAEQTPEEESEPPLATPMLHRRGW